MLQLMEKYLARLSRSLPKATGKVDITSSEIGYLGYDSPLREGLSYYGNSVVGILQNNTIHHLWIGPYFKGVQETSKSVKTEFTQILVIIVNIQGLILPMQQKIKSQEIQPVPCWQSQTQHSIRRFHIRKF